MNILRVMKHENVSCEQQVKFVQERIESTENNLSNLCMAFGNFANKSAKFRDASDEVAFAVHEYASNEAINKTLKSKLLELAEHLATLGDRRDDSTHYLERKVIDPVLKYSVHCRNAKAEIRNIFGAKERESSKRRQIIKIREKFPHNVRQIMKAESELSKACTEVTYMQKSLEEHIEIFERKKLNDLKNVLLDFAKAELAFHVEAVHIFTNAYNELNQINIDKDFKDFRSILRQTPPPIRLEAVKNNSFNNKIGNPGKRESLASFLVHPPKESSRTAAAVPTTLNEPKDISERTSVILDSAREFSYDESSDEEIEKGKLRTSMEGSCASTTGTEEIRNRGGNCSLLMLK